LRVTSIQKLLASWFQPMTLKEHDESGRPPNILQYL
jgi:hypothetical protein